MQSTLEFNLRTQEFIELIRSNLRMEAVRHARKYFSSLDGEQFAEVQKIMGLLAFPSSTDIPSYRVSSLVLSSTRALSTKLATEQQFWENTTHVDKILFLRQNNVLFWKKEDSFKKQNID